ncbi:MAG: hypothetical protein WCF44_02035 [Candidatus Methylophosphatis roskildensis]
MRTAMGRLTRNFEENRDLLREAVHRDPLWQQGRVKVGGDPRNVGDAPDLAIAPLMFWSRGHALIETTEALERLLVDSDLGEDLPVELFRPPFPACFIRFGPAFQAALTPTDGPVDFGPHHVQGVYVFESVRPIQRALTLESIYDMHDQPRFASGWMELIIVAEDDSLEQIIGEIGDRDAAAQGPDYTSLARIVAKVFLYMGLAQTARIEQRDYTTAQDRLRRLGPK